MYFDALTLSTITEELHTTILGGRIQRVLLPSSLSVALEVYAHGKRYNLILSAHPQLARVHLNASKPSRGVETHTPLLLLLRKYVLGGRIARIEQPELERIVVLSIVKGPRLRNGDAEDLAEDEQIEDSAGESTAEDGSIAEAEPESEVESDPEALQRCDLIIEAMDRRSNIVLVDDTNIIKASVRQVNAQMSRRPVQPREPYELPPRQDKRDPRHATANGIAALLEGNAGGDLARALVAAYRGLSPQAAREVVFRCLGRTDAPLAPDLPFEQLAATLRALWQPPWQPCLAFRDGVPHAFAPYLLTQFPEVVPQPGMSVALETYYSAREQISSHQQRRTALTHTLSEARERLDRQRQQLQGELERARELEDLRWEGEMIFAFLHAIQPGQTLLEVEGRPITLDPDLTAVENAQRRFRQYDKAKNAFVHVPERLAETEGRLAGLDEMLALLALADGFEQIEEIAREAAEAGYLRAESSGRKAAKGRRQQPLRVISSTGDSIYVGRSTSQNEQVTFKIGSSDDLWLHVRGIPGAHVIIKSSTGEVSDATLLEAASLAAYFSSARNDAQVEVEVSRRRLVRRIPGAPPGLVTYRAERTLRVAPRKPW